MPSEVMDCFTLFAMTVLSMESANALSKALRVPTVMAKHGIHSG
jgi:hypothetical protein